MAAATTPAPNTPMHIKLPTMTEIRALLALGSGTSAVAAFLLWRLRGDETFLPTVIPVIFAVSAVSLWTLLHFTWSKVAFVVAAVSSVTALASRAISVVVSEAIDTANINPDRNRLAFVVYVSFGALLAFWWVRVVLPMVWYANHERKHRND